MTRADDLFKANQLEGLAAYYSWLAGALDHLEPGCQMAKEYADMATARRRNATELRGGNGEAA